jgi:hypothetical protein
MPRLKRNEKRWRIPWKQLEKVGNTFNWRGLGGRNKEFHVLTIEMGVF